MKSPKNTNLYSRLALITSITLITGYLIVSATWTSMSRVGTGDQLSATLWNTFVDNLNDLDTRLKSTASTWPTVTGGIAYTGGNVGIGTTSPSQKVQIKGAVGENPALLFSANDGGANIRLRMVDSATAGLQIETGGGTGIMSILNAGNVGIGTTDPGGYRMAIRGLDDTSANGGLWVSGLTASTPALMVRNDGNVGIGTASPGHRLVIQDITNSPYLSLVGSATGFPGILMGTTGISNAGQIYYSNANNSMTFATNAAVAMTILNNGNVGIGTTNPYAKIHTLGQTFMMGSTTDLVWGSVGSVFQGEFGAASGNTYTKLESFINGGSAYGNLALNPGGGDVVIGPYETGASKFRVIQPTVGSWTALMKNTSATVGENWGLTVRAGSSSGDAGFSVMDKTSTNFHLYVRGDGNVGIGTNTPGQKLTVLGGNIALRADDNGTDAISMVSGSTEGYVYVNNAGSTKVLLSAHPSYDSYFSDNVVIGGTDSGTYKLYINGTGYLGAAAWAYSSDRRLKENITPLKYGIKEIMKLDAKKFDYIKGEKNNLGFIAQDVQSIFPELVTTGSGGMLGLKTDMMIPVLVKAIQELKKENDALKERIEGVEKR